MKRTPKSKQSRITFFRVMGGFQSNSSINLKNSEDIE